MNALSKARTVTATALAAAALGTAVIGVHLATDRGTAQALGTVQRSHPLLPAIGSGSSTGSQQDSQQQSLIQNDGTGSTGGFSQPQAPSQGVGGGQSSTHGS